MTVRLGFLNITIYAQSTSESDQQLEVYGRFRYRVDGGSWQTLVSTSDDNCWKPRTEKHTGYFGPYNTKSKCIVGEDMEFPISAKVLKIEASLKEYDPSIFDSDENFGTQKVTFTLDQPKGIYSETARHRAGRDELTWTAEFHNNGSHNYADYAPRVDWEFVPYMDSSGGDIGHLGAGKSMEAMKALASAMSDCVAFNTNGWFKQELRPKSEWSKWTSDSNRGMYIRKN